MKKLLLPIYLILVVAWILVGAFVVPHLIDLAYRGESISILNTLIRNQHTHEQGHYLVKWWRTFSVATAVMVAMIPFLWKYRDECVSPQAWYQRFVGPTSAEQLGLIRAFIFLLLLINTVWEDLPSLACLPPDLRISMGVMSLLHQIPGWDQLYGSYAALVAIKVVTCVFLALAMIGLGTRFTVPIAATLAFVHGGMLREYSHLFHTFLAPMYIALAMSFMPCADGFSLSSRWSSKRFGNEVTYGWSRYLCWVIVAGAYCCAGLSKIGNGGIWWWHGANLKRHVMMDAMNPMWFHWGNEETLVAIPIAIYSLGAIIALVAEAFYPVVLVTRWGRYVIPPMAVCMHLGIMMAQGILFVDLILIHAIMYDWTPLVRLVRSTFSTGLEASAPSPWQPGLLHCAIMGAIFTFSWCAKFEQYPLTAWQMYSDTDFTPVVQYRKVIAIYDDGSQHVADVDSWIGAMADTRFRDMFKKSESKQRLFFEALLQQARKADPRIEALAVQQFRWNFGAPQSEKELLAVQEYRDPASLKTASKNADRSPESQAVRKPRELIGAGYSTDSNR